MAELEWRAMGQPWEARARQVAEADAARGSCHQGEVVGEACCEHD